MEKSKIEGITCAEAVTINKTSMYGIYEEVVEKKPGSLFRYDNEEPSYHSRYYHKNKKKIIEKNGKIVKCRRCDKVCRYGSLSSHLLSKKCQTIYKNRLEDGYDFCDEDDLGISLDLT